MKNEVVLSFVIADFEDITHEEISQRLDLIPSKVFMKGEKKNPNFSGLSKQNCWIMGTSLDKYSSFEDQMNAMLDIIETRIDLFRFFCEKYYCEFSCALYINYGNEESTPWLHLDSRYNRLIKELNIEFDVDIYINNR